MADVVYFGTSFGDHANGWGGKLRRIVLQNGHNDPLSPHTWATDSVLIDLPESVLETMVANGQPIQAAATAGLDDNDQRWVYFGTGRYYASKDGENTDQQSFYGIKEPYTLSGGTKTFTWGSVGRNDLTDVTDVKVYRNGDYVETTIPGVSNFDTLVGAVDDSGGWVADLDWVPNKERNLGQAVLAGDILTFTTYVPFN